MCINRTRNPKPRRYAGISLVELIVSIVIIGAASAGVLGALFSATRASADPMIGKQALAIAEAMLEEVQLMPFTICDPDDANAESANGSAQCTGGTNGANDESKLALGPETGETRYSAVTPYDNVSDYNGFNSVTDPSPGIRQIDGTQFTSLSEYKVTVSVAGQAIPAFGAVPAISSTESHLITVTVTWPASGTSQFTVALHGYRVRYAPNALP